MTKKWLKTLIFLITLSFVFSSAAMALTKPVKIKLSHSGPGNSMTNAIHAGAEVFEYVLESRSAGKFDVEVYPMGTLGNESDQMEAVTSGVTQMFFASMPAVARVYLPGLAGFSPYLFQNEDVAMAVFEGPFGKKLLDEVGKKTGTIGFDYLMGYNYLAITNNQRPIERPEDLKGLKMRVMDPMGTAMFNAFGASAVPIAFAEVFTSLQTGVIDGQTNPPFLIESAKLNEVQKYLTMARTQWGYQFVLANARWFEDLSATDKKLIRDSWAVAKVTMVGMSVLREKLSMEQLAKSGMKINVLSPEVVAEFAKTGRPAGLAFMRKVAGDQFVEELLQAIKTEEKKLGL